MKLGYHITLDKPPNRIRSIRLPNDPFMQSNGYKPAPLDLSQVSLTGETSHRSPSQVRAARPLAGRLPHR